MYPTRFYWLVPQYGVNNYCVLCRVKAKKRAKTYNKELMNVVPRGFTAIPLLLTLAKMGFRPSLKFNLSSSCHSGKLTGEKDDL